MTDLKIALVGELDAEVLAHRAIPMALDVGSREMGVCIKPYWVSTTEVESTGAEALAQADGIWCVPSTPYRSLSGALAAIRLAREHGIPFLGTCGGFQYAIVEYARHVLGWTAAGHGELATAGDLVISALECALVEVAEPIVLREGTAIRSAYGQERITEEFRCRYAVNPAHVERLFAASLMVSATDASGQVRAVELADHPFFVATLFQPERLALKQARPPLVSAFVGAVVEHKAGFREKPG